MLLAVMLAGCANLPAEDKSRLDDASEACPFVPRPITYNSWAIYNASQVPPASFYTGPYIDSEGGERLENLRVNLSFEGTAEASKLRLKHVEEGYTIWIDEFKQGLLVRSNAFAQGIPFHFSGNYASGPILWGLLDDWRQREHRASTVNPLVGTQQLEYELRVICSPSEFTLLVKNTGPDNHLFTEIEHIWKDESSYPALTIFSYNSFQAIYLQREQHSPPSNSSSVQATFEPHLVTPTDYTFDFTSLGWYDLEQVRSALSSKRFDRGGEWLSQRDDSNIAGFTIHPNPTPTITLNMMDGNVRADITAEYTRTLLGETGWRTIRFLEGSEARELRSSIPASGISVSSLQGLIHEWYEVMDVEVTYVTCLDHSENPLPSLICQVGNHCHTGYPEFGRSGSWLSATTGIMSPQFILLDTAAFLEPRYC